MSLTTRLNIRLSALAAAAVCLGSAHIASAQTSVAPGTPAPGASTSPTAPGPATAQPPAPAPAAPTAPAATAAAPTPAATAAPTPRFTAAGLFDFYYLYDFNNPRRLTNNQIGPPPEYDERNLTPTLSLAELNLVYAAPANGGFAAKATLITGDTAAENVAGPREARYEDIQQLYISDISKAGYGIDFGKFYTPFGYEVTESNADLNYSRSDVYEYMEPVYHLGFRAYTPNLKGFTGTIYIVNALNNTANEGVDDDNGDKGYLGQVNYTDPKGKFVVIESLGYSDDKDVFSGEIGPGINGNNDTTLSDTDLTFTPNASNTLGFNYAYRKDTTNSIGDLSWNGYAVYYQYAINPQNAVSARYSYVDQQAIGRPWEATLTYSLKSGTAFLTRLEYRYDRMYNVGGTTVLETVPGFANSNPNSSPKDTQNTLSLSEVYTF